MNCHEHLLTYWSRKTGLILFHMYEQDLSYNSVKSWVFWYLRPQSSMSKITSPMNATKPFRVARQMKCYEIFLILFNSAWVWTKGINIHKQVKNKRSGDGLHCREIYSVNFYWLFMNSRVKQVSVNWLNVTRETSEKIERSQHFDSPMNLIREQL